MELEQVLKEKTKGSRLQIPESLCDEIARYQKAYKLKHNKKISREHIIIKMMLLGKDQLKAEALEFINQLRDNIYEDPKK